ncbi:MAG: hypothetical protein PHS86_15310, partial [Syntrophaceae bacterium]|nr:hypothetical protein [Syntrophaceae bacterium]
MLDEKNKKKVDTPIETCETRATAWLISGGNQKYLDEFKVNVHQLSSDLRNVRELDFLLFMRKDFDTPNALAFARVYRLRREVNETTLFLDGMVTVDPPRPLSDFGIQPPTDTVTRLEWPTFEKALKTALGIEFSEFPVLSGKTPAEKAYIRDLLQYAVTDDLLGPADGPHEEIIGMSVRDRYLVGKLAPPDTQVPEDQVEDLPDAAVEVAEGGDREPEVSTSQSLVPSSFGFTFCVDASIKAIEVSATWGRYERTESERINEKTEKPFRCWKRIPSGSTKLISLGNRIIEPIIIDEDCPDVVVQGTVSDPLENNDRLVTLFLVNNQIKPQENQDKAWV